MPVVGSGRTHESNSGRGRSHTTRTAGSNSSRPKKGARDSANDENVIMLGPPGVGKRSILEKWTVQRRIKGAHNGVLPSGFGVRVRPLASGANLYTVLGMDSARSLARLAKSLCGDVKVLLYVTDATDEVQIQVARHDLQELTQFDVFKFCRIVVAANKFERRTRTFSRYELMGRSMLNTDALKQHSTVLEINAHSGEGLRELYHAVTRQHVVTVGSPGRSPKAGGDKNARYGRRDAHDSKDKQLGLPTGGNGGRPLQSHPNADRGESADSYRGASQDSHFSGYAVVGDEGSPLSSRNRQ